MQHRVRLQLSITGDWDLANHPNAYAIAERVKRIVEGLFPKVSVEVQRVEARPRNEVENV